VIHHVPSFRTVVGPFLWRFGMVVKRHTPGRQDKTPPGQDAALIEAEYWQRIQGDDLEVLEILTILSQCRP